VDFSLGETQQEVASLAARVLGAGSPAAAANQLYAGPPGTGQPGTGQPGTGGPDTGPPDTRALWKELGQAGLLALALPGWLGGDGLGVMDIAVLLTEIGRAAAPVPALATLGTGVLPVLRWGSRGTQRALLAGVGTGDSVLTAALREPSDPMPRAPATIARLDDGGTVSGIKIGVPYCAMADRVLVAASLSSGGTGVVVVDPAADGVTMLRTHSSAGQPEYTLRLDEVAIADVLGGHGDGRAVADLYQLAVAGACCLADGALSAALALTTAHIGSRQQFGRPLASFQAVAQQIADTYIVARTFHLATLSACWRLQTGREAGRDLDVASYWLAGPAMTALRTCHHLHGGTGMDASYPLHRFSSLVKDLARFVGGTDYRLDRLAAGVCD
jgi:3-oxo-4-pregnene-20-carboxyl-CoA dehydrogenase alpha subunit